MSKSTINLTTALMWPSIVVLSIVIGCAMVDVTFLVWPILFGAIILSAIAAAEYLKISRKPRAADVIAGDPESHSFGIGISHLDLNEQVREGYSTSISQRANNLEHLDPVASLVAVLDHSNEVNAPGWDEVCESIVESIAKAGDARCLPVLGRVRLARGMRFRDAVDTAIAAIICKQSAGREGL